MVINYQFPYSTIIREDGEVIPASDHNKQERQLECLTDALGNYSFASGTVENRLQSVVGDIADVTSDIATIQTDILSIQSDITTIQTNATALEARVTALESAPNTLDSLDDVNAASPSINEVLTWTGTAWEPGVGVALAVASGLPGSTDESEATGITAIRFISKSGAGEDHAVTDVGSGTVYIGAGNTPDLLSTLNGLIGLVSGRMSNDPLTATTYPPGTAAGDTYSSITQNSTWVFTTDSTEFGLASEGNLILSINGVDVANIDLAANFNEANRSSGQDINSYDTTGTGDPVTNGVITFVGGDLTLNSVGPSGGIPTDEYQIGSATINLTAAALTKGYNIVTLRHVNSLGTFTATLEWFYDTDPDGNPNDPDVSSITLSENVPVLNHLSGVGYYGTGSTFNLDITGNDLFDNVFHTSEAPILISGLDNVTTSNWFGATSSILISDGAVSGLSTPPEIGETMTVANFALTVASGFQVSDARADSTPRDPYASYTTVQSTSNNFVIMSNPANSTDVYDSFRDERYRLPNTTNFNTPIPGMPGPPSLWDSTISLINASRSGELQVYDHTESSSRNRLQYPVFDYSNGANFQPQPNDDYSVLASGSRTYYRVFRSTTGDKTNGIITFPGIAEADLSAGLGLRIKVPSRTVWLDLTVNFNASTFPSNAPLSGGVDGEGCRINSGVHSLDIDGSIEFTLGTIGTNSASDRQLILEVIYASSAVTEILGTGSGLSINW